MLDEAEATLGEGPHGVFRLGTTPIATALLAKGWTTDRVSRGRLRRQKTPGAGGPTTSGNNLILKQAGFNILCTSGKN